MSKDQDKTPAEQQLEENINELEPEEQVAAISEGLHAFCDNLVAAGVDPTVIHTVLLTVFSQRMQEEGDREEHDQALEILLEEPWPEDPTLH